MTAIRTTCAYCGVGCGIAATVTGDRAVEIAGDEAHPANAGRLCSKGTHLGETVGLEGRLLHPMIGDRQVGWDDALDAVAGRMRDCIDRHGPDSVALYVSGQLLTEDYYVANKLAKGFIGTGNIDTNSRLCMASAVAAHNRAFGEDVVPCTYDDLDEADLILLVGSNTAWCHPVIWQRIEAAREARGTKLVVIDPRRTETAERADLHIAIDPDGDTALFTALLARLHREGVVSEIDTALRCELPDGFFGALNADPRISARQFEALVDLVVAHPRMVTLFSQGANQSVGGTDKGNAIINLHLATGRISQPGMGPFSITGQPNAMGGREVGGLANMLACHLGFDEDARRAVGQFWGSDRIASAAGLKAVDLFRAVHDGRVKFIWIMATNPAVSMPDAGFVRNALAKCETVVVSDVIADTDTARLAHIRLPALGWGEKDGTVTNSDRTISRQRALFPAPGEARADWRIVCDVAQRLGWGEAFDFANAAAIWREYAAMTKLSADRGRHLDLTGLADLSDDEYDALAPVRWGGRHPLARGAATSTGKARLVPVAPPAPRASDPDFPLRLNTGRYRDQWHTMTRTGLSAKLAHHRREPLVEVHPDDAANSGLTDGGLASVATARGSSLYRVSVTDRQLRGGLFVPMHFTDRTSGGGRTGHLAQDRTDPVSGQPGFKDTAARIEPFAPDWSGFLVRRDAFEPDAVAYWARSRIAAGWLYELAGEGACDVDALLPGGTRSEVSDRQRGMRRIAVSDASGRLAAALYLTRAGTLPPREWIAAQLDGTAANAQERLAARPATPAPDRGPLVCICHDVAEQDILAAIATGADQVASIGRCTRAGTNCGSCRPLIAQMIAATIAIPEDVR